LPTHTTGPDDFWKAYPALDRTGLGFIDVALREACDHFRGEVVDPPDADFKKECK